MTRIMLAIPRAMPALALMVAVLFVTAPRAALTSAVGAPAAAASTSDAGPYIYWANSAVGTIGRARLDGSHVIENFVSHAASPCGPAISGKYLYWSENNTIGRIGLDGTSLTHAFISGLGGPCGEAVQGGYIYWADAGGATGSIGRANLDGTGVNRQFINLGADQPCGLAVNGTHLYWGGLSSIGRANLNGTDVQDKFITPAGDEAPNCGLAVNGTYIYWPYCGEYCPGNGIARARVDGTQVNLNFIKGGDTPCGIAITAQSIFWANRGDGPSGDGTTIGRANLNGSGVQQRFISGAQGACGVVIGH